MKIETERLIIDEIRNKDKEGYFFNISHDKKVLQTFICPYSDDIDTFDFNKYPGRNDVFAIRKKENSNLIGIFVQFAENKEDHSLEIGYAIGSEYWNQGYMSEVVKSMIDYYFTNTDIKTIYASFFPENIASRRVMEKCGMTYSHTVEKELTYLDKERDVIYYRIDKDNG